jgi:flagellar motility protein MotE (MotC chaperone)
VTRKFGRIRAVDAVILAAGALLVLKALSYLAAPSPPELAADGLPKFAHGLARARTNYVPPDPETTGSVPEKGAKPAVAPAEAPAEPEKPRGSPSERALRERLGERREELEKRARDLEARERLIEETERRSDAKVEDARRAEERDATGRDPAAKEAAALKGLVVMYETMKPKDAARVFDRLPQDVLVPVVRLIAPRKMAEIMAAMSPEAAQKLTIALARPATSAAPEPSAPGLPPGELPALDLPSKPVARVSN